MAQGEGALEITTSRHPHAARNAGPVARAGHYNPGKTTHGGLIGGHSGDLGNVTFKRGSCTTRFVTEKFKLKEVIGRSIVIHEDADDLGMGGTAESLRTGSSGKRLDCAVIGIERE